MDVPLPTITVVTPSFNQGAFLESTIQSVVDQDYPQLEYIIIDGGSADNSIEIIKRHQDRLSHWVSEPDNGQAHAINKGFAHAKGDIFAYLNSDDLYMPGILERVADAYLAMRKRDRFWIAYAVEDFDHSGPLSVTRPKAHNRIADWIDYEANLHQPGVFWSRQLYSRVGGFDEALHYAFDRKFFMSAVLKGYRLSTAPDTIGARFRLHVSSKTSTHVGRTKEFDQEFIHASEWCKDQIGRLGRSRLKMQRLFRRAEHYGRLAQERALENIDRFPVRGLCCLARAGVAWPPLVRQRLFWGAVRRCLRRTTRSNGNVSSG